LVEQGLMSRDCERRRLEEFDDAELLHSRAARKTIGDGAAHPQKGKERIVVSNEDARCKMQGEKCRQLSGSDGITYDCRRVRESLCVGASSR